MSRPAEYRFVQALDVLFLRGNKLFGDPGSHGESLIPPWPSVAAGALRSRILVDDGFDLGAFARAQLEHPALGTPQRPGSFAITHFSLGRVNADGRAEVIATLPDDVVITEDADGKIASVSLLHPQALSAAIQSSAPTPMLPVLAQAERGKAAGGYWLTAKGFAQYLAGETPAQDTLLKSNALWSIDTRVGVGLDPATRSAADGHLFSMQAVGLRPEVGFIIGAAGAALPLRGMLRLGGDGRAAAISSATVSPVPQIALSSLAQTQRARIVLTSPGVFENGWLPNGIVTDSAGEFRIDLPGISARLVSAAVSRPETISGWDLALNEPKPAELAAPAGSVYWFDQLQATPDALGKLADLGLWGDRSDTAEHARQAQRRAEGFNRFAWAAWR